MASQTPVFIHDENLHIHGGKGAGELKSGLPRTKSVKPGVQEQKALRDLSHAEQTQAPGPSKTTTVLKETSALKSGASKVKKAAVKGSALMDQELDKCREWANEEIEYCSFNWNDMQKFKEQPLEERDREEAEMATYAMRDWTPWGLDIWMLSIYNRDILKIAKDTLDKIAKDIEDDLKLKLEPKILPPTIDDVWNSGIEDDMDDLPEADIFDIDDLGDITMKEEYA